VIVRALGALIAVALAVAPWTDAGDMHRLRTLAAAATLEPTRFEPRNVDADHDGLEDAYETRLAREYMPYISLDPDERCARDGLVARVRKHPADATKILIVYSHLFEHDCGFGSHVGDNEAFGIVIDPTRPAPEGILAIKTVSHQNTRCKRITECSTCPGDGRPACDLASDGGAEWPVLYASNGKHGQYATLGQCPLLGTCFDVCTLSKTRTRPPVVNIGEPGAPLVDDLTTQGFVNAANGWTEPSLLHVDPWNAPHFGTAGNMAGDLTDDTFTPGLCR
jgi:hypothetical protein